MTATPQPTTPTGTGRALAAVRRWRGRAGSAGRALLHAAVIVLAAGAGAVLGPLLAPAQKTEAIAALQADMAALRQDVATLAAASDAAAAATEATAALAARLDGLQEQAGAAVAASDAARAGLAALGRRLDESEAAWAAAVARDGEAGAALAAGAGQLDRLEAEVAALRQQAGELDHALAGSERRGAGGAAFALAIGQLRQAATGGAPFAVELEAARALAPGADGIGDDGPGGGLEDAFAALAAHSGGIASRAQLARALPATMDAARQAERLAAAEGWLDRTLARLEGLVSLRSLDGAREGSDATAIAARARALLDAGELAGAVDELAALSAPAAAVAADWLAAARAHLEVHAALDELARAAAATLSPARP